MKEKKLRSRFNLEILKDPPACGGGLASNISKYTFTREPVENAGEGLR
jgi:hypothetical protein